MTAEDFRRVKAWLYSIPRLKIAIENLRIELEKLDTRAASPPRWVSNPAGTFSTGGIIDSRQVRWVEFMDEYPLRRREIELDIHERQQQLECFERVMDMLRKEDARLVQLVRKKYLEKVHDRDIWENVLYTSKATFYRMRIYVVEAFYECLPGQFAHRNAS
ncbi:hypothetical protein [Desulfallas thermosapovorans]|uniref:RinA family phage transcriptional activator n=1 Tax=Desulfallas thermosapovorans DSM 6562 TaxID=1121431 RepID=A0A5S4ZR94_9FIRM|nr:hypothetical protein [Desulfallas thermosapovorans]TYO94542.1 hypothetical protein LX24_02378 [Desulfallas thermosapovorans DSM 6562]